VCMSAAVLLIIPLELQTNWELFIPSIIL